MMAAAATFLICAEVKEPLHVIGKGAYGEVVEMTYFGIGVAGKRLHPAFFTPTPTNEEVQGIRELFQNECTRMSKLNHPNLVAFLGVCLQPQPILVMELLPMSLTQYLEKYANIPSNIKNSILLDVSHGLLYLHKQTPPIAHRDLTANNVLLTSGLRAKIADFGVSRAVEPDIREHYFRMSKNPGHMYYMPPEVKLPTEFEENIRNVDKLDIFSFGVLIAHVYSQQLPESTGTHSETTRLPLTEVQQRMKYIDAVDNAVIKKLAQDCLQNFPEDRPHTSDVVAILQDACSEMEAVGTLMERDANAKVLEEENTRLKEENDLFKEENAQIKEENARLKEENARFKEENARYKRKNTQFKRKNTQIKEENTQIKEENTRLKEENDLFKEENAQIKEENAQLKEENARFKEENARYKRKNTQLKRKNTQIKEENEKECTQMKQKLHDLEAQLVSEKQEKEEKINHIESLQLELERQKEELRNRIAQQALPIFQVPSDSILRSIATDCRKYFNEIKYTLPDKLNMSREGSRELGCQMIEMAYCHCQRLILEELNRSLCKVTTSDLMCQAEDSSHQKLFAQTAYRLLCHHTVEDKVEYPKEVLTNVLQDFFGQFSVPDESHAAVTEKIKQAISLSWKLLTKGPPLALFKPTEYDSSLLDTDEKTWKGDCRRLVYFEPVIMEPSGTVLHKGVVGNH